MKTGKFQITGMTCASCQAHVTKGVQKVSGVQEVNVSLLANQMAVTYDENTVDSRAIIDAVVTESDENSVDFVNYFIDSVAVHCNGEYAAQGKIPLLFSRNAELYSRMLKFAARY